MGKIKVENLANAVAQELAAYNQDLTDGLKADVKKVAKECAADIKKTSPKLTGDYRKGWSTKTLFESEGDIRVTVFNRTDYQLAHLLEHGHAKTGGGRVEGIPHIRPAEGKAVEKIGKRAKVRVRKS